MAATMGMVELAAVAAVKTSGVSPLAAALISAGAAILGAVVGGLFTFGGQWFTEKRHRNDARLGGFAVLGVEADDALRLVYKIRAENSWPIAANRSWTETWVSVRSAILTNPADSGVTEVARAFTSIDELQHAVNLPPEPRSPLTLENNVFLLETQLRLEAALDALQRERPEKREELKGEKPELLLNEYKAKLKAEMDKEAELKAERAKEPTPEQ